MSWIDDNEAQRLALSPRALALHRRCPVVDLHVDALLTARLFGADLRQERRPGALWLPRSLPFDLARGVLSAFGFRSPFYNHVDLPRLRRGGYGLIALGLHYWPVQREAGYEEIGRQLDIFDALVADGSLRLAASAADLTGAPPGSDETEERPLFAFCGLEGAHGLGASGARHETRRLDRVEELYRRGVRYITLAHFSKNEAVAHCFGPGSFGHTPVGGLRDDDPGLSRYGRELVRKMNEVGMLVDVAHVSPRGVLEVCEVSSAPVIATHTGLRGASQGRSDKAQERNISDEGLLAIARTGGVAGVIMAPQFLTGDADGIACVVRHLRHGVRVLEQAGLDPRRHLALGSDFDGWIATIPEEVHDASDLPRLTQALCDDGFDDAQIEGILGEAFLSCWRSL